MERHNARVNPSFEGSKNLKTITRATITRNDFFAIFFRILNANAVSHEESLFGAYLYWHVILVKRWNFFQFRHRFSSWCVQQRILFSLVKTELWSRLFSESFIIMFILCCTCGGFKKPSKSIIATRALRFLTICCFLQLPSTLHTCHRLHYRF